MKKHIGILCLVLVILITFFQVCFAKEYKFEDLYETKYDRLGKPYIVEHFAVREITQATNIKVISRLSRWNI